MFFLLAFPFFLMGLFVPEGPYRLAAFVLSVLLLNTGLFRIINNSDQRFFAYKLYLVESIVVPFYLLLNILLFTRQTEELIASTDLMRSIPWSIFAFSLIPVFGVIFAVTIGRSMSHRNGLSFEGYFKAADPTFDVVSLLLILPVMGGWVTQAISLGPLAFWVAILNKTFVFFPMVAGYRYRFNPMVWCIWAGVLVVGLGLAAVTGNRGMGFFPAWFFAIGFGLSLKRKYLYFTVMMIGMVIALYASGVSAAIREVIGRKTLSDFSITEVVEAWPEIVRYMTTDASVTAGVKETNPFYKGLKRMVPWTRVVVPNMTGADGVPYRMADDLFIEAKSLLFFSKFTRYTGIQFYPSVVHAAPYGFTVNMGASKSISTVPFGWEMDGWTRAGIFGTTLYALIMFTAMAIIERLNQRLNRHNPNVRLLCLCTIWGLPFTYFSAYGIVQSLRQYVLQFVMVMILAHIMNRLGKQVKIWFPNLGVSHRRR